MFDPFIEAWRLRDLVMKGELRPRDVAEFYLARIDRLNPELGAYMTVTADRALADATRLEASRTDAAATGGTASSPRGSRKGALRRRTRRNWPVGDSAPSGTTTGSHRQKRPTPGAHWPTETWQRRGAM